MAEAVRRHPLVVIFALLAAALAAGFWGAGIRAARPGARVASDEHGQCAA